MVTIVCKMIAMLLDKTFHFGSVEMVSFQIMQDHPLTCRSSLGAQMVSDYALAVEDGQTSGLGTLDTAIMEISAKHLRIWHRRIGWKHYWYTCRLKLHA